MTEADKDKVGFQDPLENYEPKTYQDPLEEALAEQPIGAIRHEPFTVITPQMPVHEAVEKLAGLHVACLLVADEGSLVGVFSDRDALEFIILLQNEVCVQVRIQKFLGHRLKQVLRLRGNIQVVF